MTVLKQLLREARQGDAPAIEELVAKFSPVIEQECARFGILQHPELSHSDLFQEVALRVWSRIDQVNAGEEDHPEIAFDSWIRSTARSVVNNLIRSRRASKRTPPNRVQSLDEATQVWEKKRDAGRTASSIFISNEDVDQLNKTIQQYLDPKSREILNLRIVEGLSIKEISERLSLTYEQVRYNYYKSLAELESRLA